ncbi:MAG: DEAD/DEAH box helicase, partial [Candidatus Eremiobacterota bacterium]
MKNLLPRTYYAFLARHPRPTEIQAQAIPMVACGDDVLLSAPTASGKTEAYAAPLVERHLTDLQRSVLRVLVVSPTRALVNDLARRLEPPLERCGVRLARRTGDHPSSLEAIQAGLVLTTPESLDSLLSRHPRWLKDVRAVVLDELHVVHGTPRGDQLQVLLDRLQRVVTALGGPAPQRLAATATLENPERVAEQYLGPGARVARMAGHRPIQARLQRAASTEEIRAAVEAACREWKAKKVLFFTGSRREAEQLGAELRGRPPFRNHVLVHHGSLSRQERERVEKAFLTAPTALCLATTTLELGVDIGDVDLVVLGAPPPDVAGVLQRVGRGNRRTGVTRVLALYEGPGRKERMEHLLECARTGRLLSARVPFSPAVLVQQTFSLAFQNPNRFVTAAALAERLPAEARRFPAERLLERLRERGWLESSGDRFRPAPKLERLYQRGQMHHNFRAETGEEVAVVDRATGRTVGRLFRDAEGNLPDQVSLGGVTRRISADHGREV